MNEKDNFSNVQRRNSAVMAKYEWTSSLMSMQKSSEEIHDRRTKTHRKANEFLQGLLQKRSDGSLLDDNGTIDRYKNFLKYKSNSNDDDNLLNEFERRLRALNNNRKTQTSTNLKSNNNESIRTGEQTTRETETDIQYRSNSLSKLMITSSTSNNSVGSNVSFDENQTNVLLNTDESYSSSFEQSSTSSLNHSITKILYKPKARRVDGSEIHVNSTERSLRRASSDVLTLNQCYFPRSFKSREQINTNIISKKASSSSAIIQYDNNQLFHLLDQIENDCSSTDFTTMLDQLTLSTVQIDDNNISLISDNEDEIIKENIPIIPNLFDQPSLSEDYYTTFNINIENPKDIFTYTMTIGIVQLTPSLTVPYSILNGRRPLLQCSIQTSFKQIHSKRAKHICQVTAIESLTNIESLKENDILLKINNQSVWCLTTDDIKDILQEYSKQSKNCLLTIARLCQPFI